MIRFLTVFLLMAGLAGLAAAQRSYRLQPGDTLQVEVLEDPNLNRNVLVRPDGSISFPLVGTVQAGGRNIDAVARTLAAELAGNFAVEPSVLVSVAALASEEDEPELMNVYIVGEVNAPGRKEVLPGTTLLQFLAEAGGLTRFAAEKRLQLRRVNPDNREETAYRCNYRITGGQDRSGGTTVLAAGDVIVVAVRRLFE